MSLKYYALIYGTMSITVKFGKIELNDSISKMELNTPINMHAVCDVVWNPKFNSYHRTKKKIYLKCENKLKEDFFVDNNMYGYELLLQLRPYHDDGPQFVYLSDKLIAVINNLCDEVESKATNATKTYIYYARWLKYWANMCRNLFNNKAFIGSRYM